MKSRILLGIVFLLLVSTVAANDDELFIAYGGDEESVFWYGDSETIFHGGIINVTVEDNVTEVIVVVGGPGKIPTRGPLEYSIEIPPYATAGFEFLIINTFVNEGLLPVEIHCTNYLDLNNNEILDDNEVSEGFSKRVLPEEEAQYNLTMHIPWNYHGGDYKVQGYCELQDSNEPDAEAFQSFKVTPFITPFMIFLFLLIILFILLGRRRKKEKIKSAVNKKKGIAAAEKKKRNYWSG